MPSMNLKNFGLTGVASADLGLTGVSAGDELAAQAQAEILKRKKKQGLLGQQASGISSGSAMDLLGAAAPGTM